jgi:glutathione S-transferase
MADEPTRGAEGRGGLGGGILHGVSLSPFVRKVRAVLHLKSIAYDLENVMPGGMDSEFLAKSPLSKIPVWEEDGWTLPDSSAICAYLERVQPGPAIYPSDPQEFAQALFWEEYADTRLNESGGPVFFQRVVRGKFFKQPADEEIVRRHLDEVLPSVFDQLEELFVGSVDAGQLTIATISVWSFFVNLEHAECPLDAKAWPGLAAFLETMGRNEVLHALVEEERASMASV